LREYALDLVTVYSQIRREKQGDVTIYSEIPNEATITTKEIKTIVALGGEIE
jgi:hypothetical protein